MMNLASPFIKRITNSISLVLLASIACVVLGSALQWGSANVYSYALRGWHQRWQTDVGEQLNQHNLTIADAVSNSMLAWQPLHAHYQVLFAKQIEWHNFYQLVLNPATQDKAALNAQHLAEAEQHYLTAIVLRPAWPNTYVDMAELSLRQGGSLSQAWNYLIAAQAVAPNAAATLIGLTKIGFSQWPQLSTTQKKQVAEALFKLSERGNTQRLLASQMPDPVSQQRACQLLQFSGTKMKMCR